MYSVPNVLRCSFCVVLRYGEIPSYYVAGGDATLQLVQFDWQYHDICASNMQLKYLKNKNLTWNKTAHNAPVSINVAILHY
jgi:hypothetical protein